VNSLWISTVFLGLNHNYYAEGPPLWFEVPRCLVWVTAKLTCLGYLD
jgi:hypothetical protein